MLKFTISKGVLVLDPNIALFKELKALYDVKEGQKFLQVIYYRYSRDVENPFRDLNESVIDENVLRAVFNKSHWKDLKVPKATQIKFDAAEELFLKYNTTAETRLLKSVNKKLDQISTLLNKTEPVIAQEIANSGETKFNTNLTIILNLFSKIETIMKSKSLLMNAIRKEEASGKVRGGGSTSFKEKGMLRTTS